MQVGEQDRGELQVNVTDSDNAPIRDARVTISEPETAINPNSPIERLETDVSGQTQIVDLNTPPLEYCHAFVDATDSSLVFVKWYGGHDVGCIGKRL